MYGITMDWALALTMVPCATEESGMCSTNYFLLCYCTWCLVLLRIYDGYVECHFGNWIIELPAHYYVHIWKELTQFWRFVCSLDCCKLNFLLRVKFVKNRNLHLINNLVPSSVRYLISVTLWQVTQTVLP